MRSKLSKTGKYDEFITNLKTQKEKGCKANTKDQKTFQFEIPGKEKDCSDEATTFVDRTSRAIINRDPRTPGRKLHGADDDDEPAQPVYQDLCPSWMGQVF